MKKISFAVLLLTAISFTTNVQAQEKVKMNREKTVEVGGAPMYPSKNIIENAVNSKEHTTLVAAVKAAGLVETLEGKGALYCLCPNE